MKDIQDLFNKIQKAKKDQKELKTAYRDALQNSKEYVDINEELKSLRDRKKQIETAIKADFADEFEKLEDLKYELQTNSELISDMAFNQLVKGESIEVTDQYENEYEPIFRVSFKKVN